MRSCCVDRLDLDDLMAQSRLACFACTCISKICITGMQNEHRPSSVPMLIVAEIVAQHLTAAYH